MSASPSAIARLKTTVNRHLNPADDESKLVESLIIGLIAFNVTLVILETEPAIHTQYADIFFISEAISTVIFTAEYILRIWVADLDPRYKNHRLGRWRYIFSAMALVDLVAIAPFFLQHALQLGIEGGGTRIARAIRLLRLLRILKLGRYAHAVRTLSNVVLRKTEELAIATFVSTLVLILCSSVIYFIEHSAQPEAFSSIPQTMWWAVVTLTSVGYGDISPQTGLGKLVGAIICMIGVLLVALPTGILASGFLEEMREQRRGNDHDVFGYCPHCGKQLMPDEELE